METKDILLELRTKKGLSQEELAERLFVTRQAVSRWENGETTPNTETLKLLFTVLRRLYQHPAGLPQAADLPVLRHAPGRCRDQQRTGRLLQRGLLQVVLHRRPVPIHQQGAADRLLRGPHVERELARRAGPRPHGGPCAESEALGRLDPRGPPRAAERPSDRKTKRNTPGVCVSGGVLVWGPALPHTVLAVRVFCVNGRCIEKKE